MIVILCRVFEKFSLLFY